MNAAYTPWYRRLLSNSRFWILSIAVVLSINIAGLIQFEIPDGSLQTIRIEQYFGFIALLLLYTAILISPLTKVFQNLPGKAFILHARRAIGVSAFYYSFLHVYITFFQQLDGFHGIKYLDQRYSLSLVFGIFTLIILFIMAITSMDWVVRWMGFKNWKLLHRLVYAASLALLIHIMLIGPHYDNGQTVISVLTYAAAAFLITLELCRIRLVIRAKKESRA